MDARSTRPQAAAALLIGGLKDAGLTHLKKGREQTPPPSTSDSIRRCELCSLCTTRKQAVPGEGAISAKFMFVGEAPGAEEDASGLPFVGKAGKLLTRIIEDGMGTQRKDAFITNILKCRPPGNRDPLPHETASCTPWLSKQIQEVKPQVIIALGKHAACHLLGREGSLASFRGKSHRNDSSLPPIIVTYHPAYLLRNPRAKKDCWEDIQLAMKTANIAQKDS